MFLENFYEVCICCVDHLQYGEKRSGKIKPVFIDCGYLLGLGRANSKEGLLSFILCTSVFEFFDSARHYFQ